MRRKWFLITVVFIFASCGGGGGNPNPPGGGTKTPIADANRYFSLAAGQTYTYEITSMLGITGWNKTDAHIYEVIQNPHGAGMLMNLTNGGTTGDRSSTGPIFDGLTFIGTGNEDYINLQNHTTPARILPNPTPAIGGTWTNDLYLGNPGDPYLPVGALHTVAGIEDVTVGGTLYKDCLKINVTGNWDHPLEFISGGGSYWLAPDVGVVKITMNAGSMRMATIELTDVVIGNG